MNIPTSRLNRLSWTSNSTTDARAWVAVFSILVSLLVAIIYWICRIGFDNPLGPIVAVVGLNAWLTTVPFALHLVLRRSEGRFTWAASESFLTLATILGTAILGWATPRAGVSIFVLLSVTGLTVGAILLARQFARSAGRATMWFLAATMIISLWIAGVEWANGFLSPLILENVILHGGTSKVDTWYLSSLANMVQLHGISSHGLDGIPPLSYHYGSAWLFAQLSSLTGITVLDFYNLGVPVVVIPLFFRGILVASSDLRDGRTSEFVHSLHNSPILWGLLGAATVGALPPMALHAVGVWASGPLLSESYTTVIAISLLAIATFGRFWMDWRLPQRTGSSRPLAGPMLLGFVPLALCAIGIVKISQLLLIVAILGWFFLRESLWKKPLAVASMLLTVATGLVVYEHVVTAERSTGLSPFHFLEFLPTAAWVFFPFMHLFWTWAYALLRIHLEGISDFRELRLAIQSGRLREVEFIILLGIVGLIPGNVFDISSDQYYFSDFQRWVAITMLLGSPALMALLSSWFSELGSRGTRLRPLAKKLVSVALAPFVITMVLTAFAWGARVARHNLATRREIQAFVGTLPETGVARGLVMAIKSAPNQGLKTFNNSQLRPLTDPTSIKLALEASPRFDLVSSLRSLGTSSWDERKETVIFIDPDVSEFWQLLPHAPQCVYSPMFAPAVAGIPVLQGIPPGCDIPVSDLGGSYQKTTEWALESQATDADVCARASQKGFTQVVLVRSAANNQVSVVSLRCTT